MTEQAIIITDSGDAKGFYLQEIVNTVKQITDAGALKRIYNLARRLLGKQPEQPAEQNEGRALDMANLLRYVAELNDENVRRVTVVARTLAQMAREAGQKPAEPESWLDKACALLPKLPAKDQECIFWVIERKLVYGLKTPQGEGKSDDAMAQRIREERARQAEAKRGDIA